MSESPLSARSPDASIQVRPLQPTEVTAAAEVLAAAFSDPPYPWTAFTISGDRHQERLKEIFELDLRRWMPNSWPALAKRRASPTRR